MDARFEHTYVVENRTRPDKVGFFTATLGCVAVTHASQHTRVVLHRRSVRTNRPQQRALDRRGGRVEVVPVQAEASLQAQTVSGTKCRWDNIVLLNESLGNPDSGVVWHRDLHSMPQ